jgi:hypothetical protein
MGSSVLGIIIWPRKSTYSNWTELALKTIRVGVEDSWISSPASSVDERYWAGRSRERLTITVPVPLMCLTELREALPGAVKGTLLNGIIFILHLWCAFSEMLALHLGVRRSTRS